MKLIDLVSAPVQAVRPEDPLSHARNIMIKKGVSRLVVVNEDDKTTGMLTKTDISRGLRQDEPKWRRRPIDQIQVKNFMTPDLITITPNKSIEETAEIMLENDISGIPVIEDGTSGITENGELIGIITKKDLIDHYSNSDSNTIVSKIYTSDILTIHRHHTLNRAAEVMETEGVKRLVVVEENKKPTGIVTISDLTFANQNNPRDEGLAGKDLKMARKATKGGDKRLRSILKDMWVAEDVMSSPLITITPEQKASKAAKIMSENGISGIPVVENDELKGIITKTDIIADIGGQK
ncbi:CBS domain containing protein [Methanonatronarchaeum thermophilum]|uniref:CBS domain containing protein n=1 Tax=Methanonatronarchaeum thermophilum TaxID=1927129 RepID=A0A1Y3GH47_9EURY|nr:CBS domain-containing protein [Methanonatronarchaeum thermophilum]OUJ18696.1 CBS domain containing protein [Methanonatronarchaeum thermophilum]